MAEGFIFDEDIDRVRSATDIVALFAEVVPLQQRQSQYWCCCPFHNEKTPSLKIDPARQSFYCFGCHQGGDVFKFVQLTDDVSFPDAVRKLAERAHIELSNSGKPSVPTSYKARLREICRLSAEYYHRQLMRLRSEKADEARAYLAGRALGGSVPNTWNLGFAPGRESLVHHLSSKGFTGQEMVDADVAVMNPDGKLRDRFYDRIIFPISDEKGEVIAFSGRVIGKGEPKYLNSRETAIFKKKEEIFAFDRAKNSITATGTAVVMEGYTDVILAHEAGFTNAVATMGTALTIQHIRKLSKFAKRRIVYLFDGDEAGQRAIQRALQFIDFSMTPEAGRTKVELYAVTLPDNLDPADYITQYGVEEFRARVDEAVPLLEFGMAREMARFDLSRPEGRSAALASCLNLLAPIKDSILAKEYAVQMAGRLRIREEVALDQLRQVKPPAQIREDWSQEAGSEGSSGDTGQVSQTGAANIVQTDYEDPRLRFEREFLSAVACNPLESDPYVPALPTIVWRSRLHKVLASYLSDAITSTPSITCASLVAGAEKAFPTATAVLLGGRMADAGDIETLLAYLYEELVIGDMEEAIAKDRARLATLQHAGEGEDEEADALYKRIADAQRELTALKKVHRPLGN